MYETIDDLTVPWTLHGPELARRMLALADELEASKLPVVAQVIRGVITCDYDPRPDDDPGVAPPALRPAARDLGIRLRTGPAESSLRRTGEPSS